MAIRVKQFTVFDGKIHHKTGDIIETLSEEEEKSLVAAGYCEYVTVIAKEDNPEKVEKPKSNKKQQKKEGSTGDNDETVDDDGPATGHPMDEA